MRHESEATRGARRALAWQRWLRSPAPWLWLIALALVVRVVLVAAHDVPRGDVVLDVGVARSVAAGEGFGAGFERGFPKVVGEGALPPQDLADQHPPLWPLVGVLGAWFGAPFVGLQLASLLLGVLLIGMVGRVTARLIEPVHDAPECMPHVAMALTAFNWLLMDAGANGSLYTAQAVLVLALVEALAGPRTRGRVLGAGVSLGALLLLNHQCAVLVPVVPLVLVLGAAPGARLRAVFAATGACGLAFAVLGLWWARNAAAFGDPFHSVNPLYFLYRAGVEPVVLDEGARMVMRFPHGLTATLMAKASASFLLPNVLYVLSSGLIVLPCVGAVALAGVPALTRLAWLQRDRRLFGLLACLGALGAVSVLWPATKLRYLVPLAPIVIVLATRLWSERRALPWERLGALPVLLVWLGAVLLTLDDVLGSAEDARPGRWWLLAGGGLMLLVEPLRRRVFITAARGPAQAMTLAVIFALVQLGLPPHTAYHSAALTPDFFGKQVEMTRVLEGRVLTELRAAALEHDVQRVAGPIELLSWAEPALVEVTRGLPPDLLADVLTALIDDGAVGHVVLLTDDLPHDFTVIDGRVAVGLQPWLDDRLRLLHAVDYGHGLLAEHPTFADGWLFEVVE